MSKDDFINSICEVCGRGGVIAPAEIRLLSGFCGGHGGEALSLSLCPSCMNAISHLILKLSEKGGG